MIDFNRHTFPAGGGWTFFQPQTNWRNPMAMVGFDASVKAIIAHRRANKAITLKHQLSTDYDAVATELERHTRLRLGIPSPDPPSFFLRAPQSLKSAVAAAVGDVKKMWIGAETVWDCTAKDPEPADVSSRRALVCAGATEKDRCPKNGKGDFTRWFTMPLSESIRKAESRLRSRNLSTPSDASLGVCEACLCPLKLKVHCNAQVVQKHLDAEVRAELDPRCWILSEAK